MSHLEQLRKLDPSDPRILVKLVSAYSQFSPSQAEEVSVKLPLPEQAVTAATIYRQTCMDSAADALEQMPIYRHRGLSRKCKPRLPKNYDPHVKPDPERWLPLKEYGLVQNSSMHAMDVPCA